MHLIEKALLKFKEDVYFFKYEETVYDGEITSKLRLDSLAAGRTIEPYGDLYEGNIIDYSANPQWYGYFIGGMKISSFLDGDPFLFYRKNSKEKIKDVKFIKNETINGNKCIVVKETSKDTKNIITAWLDENKFYRPLKIEMQMGDERIIIENNLKQYEKDLWFPEQIIVNDYFLDGESNQYLPDTKIILTLHEKSRLNKQFAEGLFDSPFPKGVIVLDHRTSEAFVMGVDEYLK